MRAPPPPRKSRARYLTTCCLTLKQLFTGSQLKRRWHLHKLHKFKRRGQLAVSPISGVHVEDMMNLPTGLQNGSAKSKPLLIAAFSKGCAQSPELRLLQRNKCYGLPLTKRKYKLKNFDANITEGKSNEQQVSQRTHLCAPRVGSIKKVTSKDADLKVIFHNNNVIKSINLQNESHSNSQSPQILEFAPQQSIRIKDYPSLARKPVGLEEIKENGNKSKKEKEISSGSSLQPINLPSASSSMDSGSTAVSPDARPFIRITKYSNGNSLISYSQLITPHTS